MEVIMEGIMGFLSIIILGAGLFVLYAWYNMVFNGVISESLFLGKHYDANKIKDRDAFIKKASPALLVFGVVTTICGAITTLRHYMFQESELLILLDPVSNAIVLIVLICFAIYTGKLKKLYF
jgi:hypothetical protein